MRKSVDARDAQIPPPATLAHQVAAKILIIDPDAMLAADARDLGFSALEVQSAASVAEIELALRRGCDVAVISLDLAGGFEAMERLCADRNGPPVIAIASRGRNGASLEHTLTLAELRGAAATLPKPVDASELALAAVNVLAMLRPADARLGKLAGELEKLALF